MTLPSGMVGMDGMVPSYPGMSGMSYAQPQSSPPPQMIYVAPAQQPLSIKAKIGYGILGVILLFIIYYLMYPSDAASTGVITKEVDSSSSSTTSDSTYPVATLPRPVQSPPLQSLPTPAISPVVIPKPQLTKYVVITKDTSNITSDTPPVGENSDWRTFQVGEVKIYDADDNQLKISAAEMTHTPSGYGASYVAALAYDGNAGTFAHTDGPTHIHELKLTVPVSKVAKVAVYNRQDCCQHRLSGAVLSLLDESGAVLFMKNLDASQVQTYTF